MSDRSGRPASQVHTARLRPARWDLESHSAVWDELECRGVSVASVPFKGRAGQGGQIDPIRLRRVRREGDGPLDVRLRPEGDELSYALAAPAWDRFDTFAGSDWQPEGDLDAKDRTAVIAGGRGNRRFSERAE